MLVAVVYYNVENVIMTLFQVRHYLLKCKYLSCVKNDP